MTIASLELILTNECNFNCKYCYQKNTIFQKNKEFNLLNKNKIFKLIDMLFTEKNEIKEIVFSGGEPFLKIDLLKEVINHISYISNNVNFVIITNGSINIQPYHDFLIEHNVKIKISIDGSRSVNSKNRDNVSTIIKNIKLLKNYPGFGINTVVSDNNYSEIFSSFKYLYNLGCRRFYFLKNVFCSCWLDKRSFLSNQLRKISMFYLKHKNIYINYIDNEQKDLCSLDQCYSKSNRLVILPNGDIFSCLIPTMITNKYNYSSFKITNIDNVSEKNQLNVCLNKFKYKKFNFIDEKSCLSKNEKSNLLFFNELFLNEQKFVRENLIYEHLIKQINIQLNGFCNLSCNFCHLKKDNSLLDIPKAKQFIKEFTKERDNLIIKIFGTEPFCSKPELYSLLSEFGKTHKIILNTNGHLLSQEDISKIYKLCADYQLTISYDSSKWNEKDFISKFFFIKDIYKKNIFLNVVLLEDMLPDITNFLRKAIQCGFTNINILPQYFKKLDNLYIEKLKYYLIEIKRLFALNNINFQDRLNSIFNHPLASNNLTITSNNRLLISELGLLDQYEKYYRHFYILDLKKFNKFNLKSILNRQYLLKKFYNISNEIKIDKNFLVLKKIFDNNFF